MAVAFGSSGTSTPSPRQDPGHVGATPPMTRRVTAFLRCSLVVAAAHLGACVTPRVGETVPPFVMRDLTGAVRTQRDLTGVWQVCLLAGDDDALKAVADWFHRLRIAAPGVPIMTLLATDLFAFLPTSSLVNDLRESTPRHRWREVWVARDGLLVGSLSIFDTDVPWVWVVDPQGRVAESLYGDVSPAGLGRVLSALPRAARGR
jgi:hypothetical protein